MAQPRRRLLQWPEGRATCSLGIHDAARSREGGGGGRWRAAGGAEYGQDGRRWGEVEVAVRVLEQAGCRGLEGSGAYVRMHWCLRWHWLARGNAGGGRRHGGSGGWQRCTSGGFRGPEGGLKARGGERDGECGARARGGGASGGAEGEWSGRRHL